MVQFNFIQKEATYKILYFGPTGSGKTSNLKYLAQKITPKGRSQLSTISASAKDNLWIDFLTVEAGISAGMKTRFNIFTLPSQEPYESVRKLFLQDADGLVFIADSTKIEENLFVLQGIEKNLQENGSSLHQIPLVIQWNKRDLASALDTNLLHDRINYPGVIEYTASAITGKGVFNTIEKLATLAIKAAIASKQYHIQRKKLSTEDESQDQRISLSIFQEDEGEKNLQQEGKTKTPDGITDRMKLTRTRLFALKSSSGSDKEELHVEESERDSSVGKVVFLKLFGSIHPASSPIIKNKVMDYYNQGNARIILDMENIEYIHSTGFGMLIEIGNRAKIMGGGISLISLPEKFKTPFELMGMNKSVSLFKNETEALSSLKSVEKVSTDTQNPANISVNLTWKHPKLASIIPPPQKNQNSGNPIYIIYERSDIDLLKRLEEDISAQGYAVTIDRKRLKEDISWSMENSQMIQESQIILLLWTDSSSKSTLVSQEWVLARGLGKKIIPCMQGASPILPVPLQSLESVDLRYYEKAISKVSEMLSEKFPYPYNYNMVPPCSYIPFTPNPYFIERDQELSLLYHLILNHKNVIITHDGPFMEIEGIGKTRLAIEFAYRMSFLFPDGILWINGAGNFHKEFQMAAYELGLVEVSPNFQLSFTSLRKLKSYIKNHPDMLLIIDNLEDTTMLEQEIAPGIIPMQLGCYLLCTSNSKSKIPDTASLFLEALSPESSMQLFLNIAKNRQGQEIEMLRTLINLSGGLPLAIEMMAKFLMKNSQLTITQYYRSFSEQRSHPAEETNKLSFSILLNTILKKQTDGLQDDYVQKLIEIAGWFPKSTILSQETIGIFAGVASDTVRAQVYLKNPIERLQELSLIDVIAENSIRMHPCVYRFFQNARYDIDPEQQKNTKKKAAERMFSCYQDFARLEKDYEKRGFIPLLEDIETGLSWNENHIELQEIAKYFHRESHAIQQQRFMPHYFIQQLYSRVYGESEGEALLLKNLQDSLPRVSWQKGSFWLKRCNKFPPAVLREKHEVFVSGMNRAILSPNNQQMAFASFDNLSLWDTYNGKLLHNFLSNSAGSRALVFNSQGSRLLVSHFNEIKSWNVNEPKDVYTLLKQTDCILALAISSRDLLACAGKDKVVYLWDMLTSKEKGILRGHDSNIHCLCFSKDATKLLSGGYDKTVALWELSRNDLLYTIRAHCDVVTSVCFSPNGEIFLSGGKDGQIRLWETNTGIPIGSLPGHRGEITSLAFCPQGNYILSAGTDTCLKLWDASSGKLLQTFVAEYPVIQCQFSQDGNYIWACDALPTIYKFRLMKINVSL